MKTNFSDEALGIWKEILGNRTYLNPRSKEIVTNAIIEELDLTPVMVRYGDGPLKAFDHGEFRTEQPAKYKGDDNWCRLYYTPEDCELATGSKAANWRQWENRLLGHGRKNCLHAPKLRPPADVLATLRACGQMKNRSKTARFLSLEVVVFYLAAQTTTWTKNPHRILKLKDRIRGLGISAISFAVPHANQDPVDVDGLFAENDNGANNGADIRVPKAGRGLVSYNPALTVGTQDGDEVAPAEKGDIEDILVEIEGAAVAAVDPTDLSDEDLRAEIHRMQALLAQRDARRLRAAFQAEAEQGQVLGGDVWPDRGEWATMQVQFPNGNTVVFYHEHLMQDKVAEAAHRPGDELGLERF